ncbi:MAG: sigma-54-dependent Fis family transcriptional regulator [Alphaproteobacteria bacterium]|nr:sigma-54-dependent Fis family transcriptional regulator [Alphaproteobacteria bacterium]
MPLDILIVDDEADIRDLLCDILKEHGHTTRTAKDSDSALAALSERLPSAVILDIWLQGSELDGMGILELICERFPNLPVIMISGHGNIETAVGCIKMGAFDFIEKPFEEDRLMLIVDRALEKARLKEENAQLKRMSARETELIGNSAAIQQVRQSVERVAPTNSRILITGPAGSGKEVAARVIHEKSKRAGGPFVVLNAVSMAPESALATLFGTEESASLTGPKKIGVFERAHGGTLFIDEVADMPMETQSKILRVLQDQQFIRVGGTKPVSVDVRVIAATSKDLTHEIAEGRFREDLYYRLNVVPIKVPTLRERREDINVFCQHFLKRASEMTGLPARQLADDALAMLQSYDWPGNVRQLRNVMEWLLIMTPQDSGQVKASMLPSDLLNANPVTLRPEANADIMALPLREAREIFERQYLMAQITRFGGNISKTSAFVGMERSALHRKLKSLGIHSSEEKLENAAA